MRRLREKLVQAVAACADIESLKKPIRKGAMVLPSLEPPTPDQVKRLRSESGDGLWYKAVGASMFGDRLSTVASCNLQKLAERRAAGVIASSGETVEGRKRELREPARDKNA